MASIVEPLEVAQIRLMLAMEILRGIKDLQPRGFPLHACFALLNLFCERKEPWLWARCYASVVIDLHIRVEPKKRNLAMPGFFHACELPTARSGFGGFGGKCSRHGCGQEHASGDGEEAHGWGKNISAIISTDGVSFCCRCHGILKIHPCGRPRSFLEACPGGLGMRSTAISPCCASRHPSIVRCASSIPHSEITASTISRRRPSNAMALPNRCSL